LFAEVFILWMAGNSYKTAGRTSDLLNLLLLLVNCLIRGDLG